ncbi:hypothetical protein J2X69_002380 [Algoriphagus sp. 4150]|nr:hypothetical protein [Algoriphagus sp. 4150]
MEAITNLLIEAWVSFAIFLLNESGKLNFFSNLVGEIVYGFIGFF